MSEVIAFALLNVTGLAMAIATGAWRLQQLYDAAYFPIVITVWVLGALGYLPRVKASTQNEGHERRYFYGSVWAVCVAGSNTHAPATRPGPRWRQRWPQSKVVLTDGLSVPAWHKPMNG